MIFLWLRHSVYGKKASKLKDFLVVGLLTSVFMAVFIFIPRTFPPFGYPVQAGSMVYVIAGIAVIAFAQWIDRRCRLTK